MRRSLPTVTLLATVAIAGVAFAKDPPAKAVAKTAPAPSESNMEKPQIGSFGFDEAGMDRAVKPGDDFADFAGGTWYEKTEIPADRAAYGMFNVLQDLSLSRTKSILEEATKTPGNKSGDFYASFMDEAAADAKGITPIEPWLAEIRAARTKPALATEMAKLQRVGVGGLIGMGIGQDDKAPDQYIANFYQGGLGLPDRDYYLKDDAKLADIRGKYQTYLATMLTLAGERNAETRAAAVYGLEKALASVHWTRIESRDADKTYNKWTFAEFDAKAPGFPWDAYAKAAGISGRDSYLVAQPSALTGEAKVFADTPVAVLQDYLTLKVLRSYSGYLSKPINDANFAFYGTVLSGAPQQQVRWKRAVGTVSSALGEDIGQQYVARYFPPESKAAADSLVKNIIAAMNVRIDKLTWMAPATKVEAHAKLATFVPRIGYPDKWHDYAALRIAAGDAFGNDLRAKQWAHDYNASKLGQAVYRWEWGLAPMTVNAQANPTLVAITFPAAILQPPFFDPAADAAVNYGGIGAVIGHEMSHHFDDQGSKFNTRGQLAQWWTDEDVTKFKALSGNLVAEYDKYEPLPGMHVKGALTLGENSADLAGLSASYDAYHVSLHGKPAPVIEGFTGDQRFYLGWAQVWRRNYREAALRQRLLTDPHSPSEQRAWIVRNMAPWYAAFTPAPGDKLYLTPEQRVVIW